VAEWLRNAYLELTQETTLDFEELRPRAAEPYSNSMDRNWEADAKKWEATSRDWETLARIFYLKTKVAAPTGTVIVTSRHYCDECNRSYSNASLCKCRLLAMVDETFRGELESLREHVELEHPLPHNSTDSAALSKVSRGSKKKGKK